MPEPRITGATVTCSRSSSPAARKRETVCPPPSTKMRASPRAERARSSAARSSPPAASRGRRSTSASPCRSGPGASSAQARMVRGPPEKTRWPVPSRRAGSSTTRTGSGPGTSRVVSRGSSCRTVPAPTSTTSHSARRRCVWRMSPAPPIHCEDPERVAIRPSSVCASRPMTRQPSIATGGSSTGPKSGSSGTVPPSRAASSASQPPSCNAPVSMPFPMPEEGGRRQPDQARAARESGAVPRGASRRPRAP
jgi:hypothetical protein